MSDAEKDGARGPAGTEPQDPSTPPGRQRVLNLPAMVTWPIAFMALVYAAEAYVLPAATVSWISETFGFIPMRYDMPFDLQGPERLWSPITYSFLHGGLEHLLFNCLWLAAFGAPVARRIGSLRFAVFWCLSAAASAFVFYALHRGEYLVLVGASGVISGLMGAACRFAFPPPGQGYSGARAHLNRRFGLMESFRSRTVLTFTLFWILSNLLLVTGLMGDLGQSVAWEAHVGGFLFGFLLFGLFDRPPALRV